eukprot:6172085-Prymnesium_polylepis.1
MTWYPGWMKCLSGTPALHCFERCHICTGRSLDAFATASLASVKHFYHVGQSSTLSGGGSQPGVNSCFSTACRRSPTHR